MWDNTRYRARSFLRSAFRSRRRLVVYDLIVGGGVVHGSRMKLGLLGSGSGFKLSNSVWGRYSLGQTGILDADVITA